MEFTFLVTWYIILEKVAIERVSGEGLCNYEFNYANYLKLLEISPSYVENSFLPQYIKIKIFRKSVAGGRGTQLMLDKPDTFLLFDPDIPTQIIVHGYVAGSETSQVTRIRDAYLLSYDNNVITVDWTPFAGVDIDSTQQYHLAFAFMNELVAPFLAKHVEYLINNLKTPSTNIHLIGHSLGAHLVGMVGKKVKVDWITGLDPALPGYAKDQTETRLEPTDATFVEIIHTNVGEYGEEWPCGTVDYYVNGGGPQQPHTHPDDKQAHHAYSYIIYSGALEFHTIEGTKCPSEEAALLGKCPSSQTARIGDRNARRKKY